MEFNSSEERVGLFSAIISRFDLSKVDFKILFLLIEIVRLSNERYTPIPSFRAMAKALYLDPAQVSRGMKNLFEIGILQNTDTIEEHGVRINTDTDSWQEDTLKPRRVTIEDLNRVARNYVEITGKTLVNPYHQAKNNGGGETIK